MNISTFQQTSQLIDVLQLINTIDSDYYGETDKLDDVKIALIADRMEKRFKIDKFRMAVEDYISELKVDRNDNVLEIGGGTGVVSRYLTSNKLTDKPIICTDLSEQLLAFGKAKAKEEGLAHAIEFSKQDCSSLQYPDETFDIVIAHTVFLHVNDINNALSEAVRVLKDKGRLVIFDHDAPSIAFGLVEELQQERILNSLVSKAINNPSFIRDFPSIAKANSLHIKSTFSYSIADIGQANFWKEAIETAEQLIPISARIRNPELKHWVANLIKKSKNGTFFCSGHFHTYICTKNKK